MMVVKMMVLIRLKASLDDTNSDLFLQILPLHIIFSMYGQINFQNQKQTGLSNIFGDNKNSTNAVLIAFVSLIFFETRIKNWDRKKRSRGCYCVQKYNSRKFSSAAVFLPGNLILQSCFTSFYPHQCSGFIVYTVSTCRCWIMNINWSLLLSHPEAEKPG